MEGLRWEYIRKYRWANYETPKCKEYLRNDFSHECAYCKLQEKEVGIIDGTYFEVDILDLNRMRIHRLIHICTVICIIHVENVIVKKVIHGVNCYLIRVKMIFFQENVLRLLVDIMKIHCLNILHKMTEENIILIHLN